MGEILTRDEPDGVLIVNKHAGATSHDVVNDVRHLYGTKKVGHTGTLDPMATGVLVLLLGRAAKACEYLSADSKEYRARIRFGLTSDTEDTTGTVLTRSEGRPALKDVQAVLPSFTGKIRQIPPMYSALKVNGQKLCDLARKGITVERDAREIEIFSLTAHDTERGDEYLLDVTCSGGTYIRTLCADIGERLGCGAVMAALERRRTGSFSIGESHTVAELREMDEGERLSLLVPTERLFEDLPEVRLPAFYERLCRSGNEIYLQKINADYPVGTRLRISDEKGAFFAIGDVGMYENGPAVKAIKLFVL